MYQDNEIYVTSNGELYKKGVKQAINPQTNYTVQQFYTKEEYDKLQAENERLKEENEEYKRYKYLFEKAREMKIKTDKWAQKCLSENEDLKDSIKRTVCQAECFRYKQANNYKQALQEIRCVVDKNISFMDTSSTTKAMIRIQDKINSVIGAE